MPSRVRGPGSLERRCGGNQESTGMVSEGQRLTTTHTKAEPHIIAGGWTAALNEG